MNKRFCITEDYWREARREVNKIINSANTSGQLLELWPEVINFLPDSVKNYGIVNSSTEVTVLDTNKVNLLLGIKSVKKSNN